MWEITLPRRELTISATSIRASIQEVAPLFNQYRPCQTQRSIAFMLRRTNSQNKWEMYLNTRWLCLSSTVRYTKIKAPSWQMKITGAWKATNTPWVLISNKDHSCTVQIISKMIILQNTIRSECSTNSNRNKSNNYRDKMISFLNPIRI